MNCDVWIVKSGHLNVSLNTRGNKYRTQPGPVHSCPTKSSGWVIVEATDEMDLSVMSRVYKVTTTEMAAKIQKK
jgi:hypothetical protein